MERSKIQLDSLKRHIRDLMEQVKEMKSEHQLNVPSRDTEFEEKFNEKRLELQAAQDMMKDFEKETEELARRSRKEIEEMKIDIRSFLQRIASNK